MDGKKNAADLSHADDGWISPKSKRIRPNDGPSAAAEQASNRAAENEHDKMAAPSSGVNVMKSLRQLAYIACYEGSKLVKRDRPYEPKIVEFTLFEQVSQSEDGGVGFSPNQKPSPVKLEDLNDTIDGNGDSAVSFTANEVTASGAVVVTVQRGSFRSVSALGHYSDEDIDLSDEEYDSMTWPLPQRFNRRHSYHSIPWKIAVDTQNKKANLVQVLAKAGPATTTSVPISNIEKPPKSQNDSDDDLPQPRFDNDNGDLTEHDEEDDDDNESVILPSDLSSDESFDRYNIPLASWGNCDRGLEMFQYDYAHSRNNTTLCCYKVVKDDSDMGLLHIALYNLYHTPYEGAVFYCRIEYDIDVYPKEAPYITMISDTGLYAPNVAFRPIIQSMAPNRWSISNVICHLISELITYGTNGGFGDAATFQCQFPDSMTRNLNNPDFCHYFPIISELYRKRFIHQNRIEDELEHLRREQDEQRNDMEVREIVGTGNVSRAVQLFIGIFAFMTFFILHGSLMKFSILTGTMIQSWFDHIWP